MGLLPILAIYPAAIAARRLQLDGSLDTLDDHFDLVNHDRVVYQQYHHHDNGNNDADGAGAEFSGVIPRLSTVWGGQMLMLDVGSPSPLPFDRPGVH